MNTRKTLILLGSILIAWTIIHFLNTGPSKDSHKRWIKEWYPQAQNIEVFDIREEENRKYVTFVKFDISKQKKDCSTIVFATDLGKRLYNLEENFKGCKSK
ncbi:MAG TPA: hypothetical protein EYO73_00660 [Sulfurimonas sp.]|nr:hypothetical protein [Sulfurimonas sp.]